MKRHAAALIWALFLVCALLAYLFANGTGTRVLLALAFCLPLLSALALLLPRHRISLETEAVPDRIVHTQQSTIHFKLRHGSRIPVLFSCTLRCINEMTGEQSERPISVYLSAKAASSEGSVAFRPAHCGVISVLAEDCRLHDLLGLFSKSAGLQAAAEIRSLPQPLHVHVSLAQTADSLTEQQQYSTSAPGSDPSETFRLREYRPGDPIRQIHWKLSEKTDRVFVRDYGLPIVEQMLLLVDLNRPEYLTYAPDAADRLLSCLCAVSRSLQAQQIPHAICWQDAHSGTLSRFAVSEETELAEALGSLLRTPVGHCAESLCSRFARSGEGIFAHIALLAPDPDPELELLGRGNRVTVLMPADRLRSVGAESLSAVLLPLPEDGAALEL